MAKLTSKFSLRPWANFLLHKWLFAQGSWSFSRGPRNRLLNPPYSQHYRRLPLLEFPHGRWLYCLERCDGRIWECFLQFEGVGAWKNHGCGSPHLRNFIPGQYNDGFFKHRLYLFFLWNMLQFRYTWAMGGHILLFGHFDIGYQVVGLFDIDQGGYEASGGGGRSKYIAVKICARPSLFFILSLFLISF